jgi:hypothetical protein
MRYQDLKEQRDREFGKRAEHKGRKRPGLAVRQRAMRERHLTLCRSEKTVTCSLCGAKGHCRDLHVEAFSGVERWRPDDDTGKPRVDPFGNVIPGWTPTTYTEVEPPERRHYGVREEPVVQHARKPEAIAAFKDACAKDFRSEYVGPHYRQLFSIRKLLRQNYSGPEIARRLRMKYPTFRRRLLELQTLTQGINL